MNAGAYALEGIEDMDEGPARTETLQLARTLYAAAVRADATDAAARTTLADVLMSLGYAAQAAGQYQRALRHRPLNIRTVRNLADVALDAKDPRKTGPAAREAYRRVIEHCYEAGTNVVEEGAFEWSDLRIYLEFFGIGDEEQDWGRAAGELKEVARWLLGRREETCWEGWEYDDREWDVNDDRRVLVPGYEPGRFPLQSYGLALPVDLRAKLVIYRLRLGQHQEAALHMECLDPKDERGHDLPAMERFRYFPDCLKDVGAELLAHDQPAVALDYFDLYRRIAAENPEDVVVDADMLVNQGRCYLALGNKVAAEECFIGALDEDEYHIDARFELAKLYEAESEKEGREEAFLLVNEALDLEARQGGDGDRAGLAGGPKKRRSNYQRARREPKPKKDRVPRAPRPPGEKRKYRPRRLGGSAEKQRQEMERKNAMLDKYRAAADLRPQVAGGDPEAMARWMSVAKDLVDDFRSSKQFFPWDKYVRFMGYNTILSTDAIPAKSSKLAAMAARLQQNLAPVEGQDASAAQHQLPPALRHDHYGIPFEEWLDLLLDYALNLTFANQVEEAYVVLLSARDSVVFKSRDHAFLIHITWALCAVYAGDEEQCVHIARFFMRDYMPGTDSYRLFAAMVRLCQAPPSWYTSGPGQKFILRQIKLMDKAAVSDSGEVNPAQLDVCLLTIYGHILYTSQSYPYALSYFMRAASIDPTNPMINLSLGIGYIQYALKRQAPNRQYLITQGFAFFQKYYRHRVASPHAGERQEAKFNMGRAYHILGLGHLAVKYYSEVLDESKEMKDGGQQQLETSAAEAEAEAVMGREDLALEAAYNIKTICFQMGDLEGARAITEEWLVVE